MERTKDGNGGPVWWNSPNLPRGTQLLTRLRAPFSVRGSLVVQRYQAIEFAYFVTRMAGMNLARSAVLILALGLGACASAGGLEGQRTVFSNPFVPPVIDQRGIGPGCEVDAEPGSLCTSGALIYPGRGRFALLGNREFIRLNRAERQFLRDRADALEAQRDVSESLANGTPLPPGSPALPENQRSRAPASPPPAAPGQREAP
jgi:hypothetical protein